MRIKLVVILIFVSGNCLQAQQLPIFTNYNFNILGINPAVAGSQPCLDLRMGQRRQWVGFDGAPITNFISVNGSFGKKRFNYHGAGVTVEDDTFGRFATQSILGNYAYHMKVNRKNMLSLGASLGFSRFVFNPGGAVTEVEETIPSTSAEFLFPQIGVGLWYQSSDRYIGFSARNLIESKIDNAGSDSRFRRHYYLILGKSIPVDDNLFFKPSVNFRYVSGSPVAADVSLLFDFNDVFEFGVSARGGHGVSGIVKVGVLKYLTLGYAYDRTLNKLRVGSASSHEIMLGIKACPRGEKKGISCSAYD